ncbi:MAG: SH3 domain-containing protein, partial [Myxococcota bacterium]
DGTTYRWRVEVFGPGKRVASIEWQQLTVDLSEPEPAEKPRTSQDRPPESGTGTITADTLNVRKGPGTGHAVIGQFRRGEKIVIRKKEGNWIQTRIKKGGRFLTGWVHGGYVRVD